MNCPKPDLLGLPAELTLQIAGHLIGDSLRAFALVCKCTLLLVSELAAKEYRRGVLLVWKHEEVRYPELYNFAKDRPNLDSTGCDRYKALIEACQNGDVRSVKALLADNVSLRGPRGMYHDPFNRLYTPLHAAIHGNQAEIVKFLLASGAEIDTGLNLEKNLRFFLSAKADEETLGVVVRAVRKRGGDPQYDELPIIAANGYFPPATISNLIKHELWHDQAYREHEYCTPTGVAIVGKQSTSPSQHREIVRFLLNDKTRRESVCYTKRGWYPIHKAAQGGSADILRLILEEFHADPNLKAAKSNDTPLHVVIRYGSFNKECIEKAKILINAGARVHQDSLRIAIRKGLPDLVRPILDAWQVQHGLQSPCTLLVAAAMARDISLIEKLLPLSKPSDKEYRRFNPGKALIKAAQLQYDDVFDVLYPHVSTLRPPKGEKETVLHWSLVHGTEERINRILAHPASRDLVSSCTRQLICLALKHQPLSVLASILSRVQTSIARADVAKILFTIAELGDEDALFLILKHVGRKGAKGQAREYRSHKQAQALGFPIPMLYLDSPRRNRKEPRPVTFPLFPAIKQGHLGIVQALINWYPGYVDLESESHDSALSLAVYYNKPQIVQVLLEAGAKPESFFILGPDPRAPTWLIKTSLIIHAAQYGYTEIVKSFLAHGYDVNTKDAEMKRSLIGWAALGGHEALVRTLLGAGASIEEYDGDCNSIVYLALQEGQEDLRARMLGFVLFRKYDRIPRETYNAIISDRAACGRLLIDHGVAWFCLVADPDSSCLIGLSPLAAIQFDLAPIVQLYIDLGVVKNEPGTYGDGQTWVLRAVEAKAPNVVRLLVQAGFDALTADSKGRTPLGIMGNYEHVLDNAIIKAFYSNR